MSIPSRLPLATAALMAAAALFAATARADETHMERLPPLEKPVTSLGAAVADGWLYVFGGHLGTPHEYSAEMQANQLWRLNVAKPGKWESLGEGPRRTGLAMVAYDGQLYRVGGWEAKNATGEQWELYSTPDFSRFNPKAGKWQELAPLPQGRSSHDAAMLDSKLYVVGGWELKGAKDSEWQDTALVCDLASDKPEWKEIAKPPFHRRALAVAAHAGKIYAIGGMDDSNEMTAAVDIYDSHSNRWSKGPPLPGEAHEGFGATAFGTQSGLYVSTRSGALYRLDTAGTAWTQIGKLDHPRSFHRLVAVGADRLLVVGGTGPGGKVAEIESISVARAANDK